MTGDDDDDDDNEKTMDMTLDNNSEMLMMHNDERQYGMMPNTSMADNSENDFPQYLTVGRRKY